MTVLATLILKRGRAFLVFVSKLEAINFTLLAQLDMTLNSFFIFSKHGLKSLKRDFQFYLLNQRNNVRLAIT